MTLHAVTLFQWQVLHARDFFLNLIFLYQVEKNPVNIHSLWIYAGYNIDLTPNSTCFLFLHTLNQTKEVRIPPVLHATTLTIMKC
jgi:hypothetical protein